MLCGIGVGDASHKRVLVQIHPEEPIYTIWDHFRDLYARNAGIRIDHFLLKAPAPKLLNAAGVDCRVRG